MKIPGYYNWSVALPTIVGKREAAELCDRVEIQGKKIDHYNGKEGSNFLVL